MTETLTQCRVSRQAQAASESIPHDGVPAAEPWPARRQGLCWLLASGPPFGSHGSRSIRNCKVMTRRVTGFSCRSKALGRVGT